MRMANSEEDGCLKLGWGGGEGSFRQLCTYRAHSGWLGRAPFPTPPPLPRATPARQGTQGVPLCEGCGPPVTRVSQFWDGYVIGPVADAGQ